MVRMVENLKEFKDILKESGSKLVVVDFTAKWCGPCQRIAPDYEALSIHPANGDVVFLKVDVDEAEDVTSEYGIQSMPTFMFFRGEKKLGQFSGANIDMLRSEIQKYRG
ncbi:thioredoxin-like [Salarias fasciatus]|uniref:Thioredoxin n=1 Tax=Salarias fasciatus TaxID=181472 RepID=A0A672FML3_SALFA|nr:thioredoxin-like [Salarias fasciatus]